MHYGAAVAVQDDGKVLFALGNPELKTFFRSSSKPFQALPLVESDAHKKFGLTTEELALTCASHNGEPFHIDAAASILQKLGLDESSLQCGAHAPYNRNAAKALIQTGVKPSALHNNCSGKHSGMLASCLANGWDTKTYLDLNHPLQQKIFEHISNFSGVPKSEIATAIDGCSVPTFFLPLVSMARMFAMMGARREVCLNVLTSAMTAAPQMVAGTDEFDTRLMQAGKGNIVCKRGGAAITCVAVSDGRTGIGIVVKSIDGAMDVPPLMVMRVLEILEISTDDVRSQLSAFVAPVQKNVNGWNVGKLIAAF